MVVLGGEVVSYERGIPEMVVSDRGGLDVVPRVDVSAHAIATEIHAQVSTCFTLVCVRECV